MSNILYRYRMAAALLGAITMGVCAIAVMPATAADLVRIIASAAAPQCSGSQNPFISAPS